MGAKRFINSHQIQSMIATETNQTIPTAFQGLAQARTRVDTATATRVENRGNVEATTAIALALVALIPTRHRSIQES